MNSITLTLPFPPSANRYWRRGRNGSIYVSKEAKEYKEAVKFSVREQLPAHSSIEIPVFSGPVIVSIDAYMPQDNRDLGNTEKVLSDALQGILFEDDIQIHELHIYRYEARPPKRANARAIVTVRSKL